MTRFFGLLAGALLTLGALPAYAACSISDVSLTIDSNLYTPSLCANGVSQGGGPTTEMASLSHALNLAGSTDTFTLAASSDGTSATISGIKFTVTAASSVIGGWTVNWKDTNGATTLNLPISVDFSVGLLGGDNGAGYQFDSVILTNGPFAGTGTFDVTFKNHGGNFPTLSHLLLGTFGAAECGDCGNGGGGGGDPIPPVAEPASLFILGAGLFGLGVARRRRRQ